MLKRQGQDPTGPECARRDLSRFFLADRDARVRGTGHAGSAGNCRELPPPTYRPLPRCYRTDVTHSTDSGLWRNGSPETGTFSLSLSLSRRRCLAPAVLRMSLVSRGTTQLKKEEAIPRGAMWMAELPRFPGMAWPRVAGSPSIPDQLTGPRTLVRTRACLLALLTGHKPASPHVVCAKNQPRASPRHGRGEKVARPRCLWATSDSLPSGQTGAGPGPADWGRGPEPTEGRRDGVTVWWSYGLQLQGCCTSRPL